MKRKVVITDFGFPDVFQETEKLNALGYEVVATHCATEEDVLACTKEAAALLVQWAPITRKVIEGLSNCKIIVRYGIGVDNIDLDAAKEKNIPVCNVPDYCINEVADHTIALALTLGRQLASTDKRLRAGIWKITPPGKMKAFREMTFATIGYGRIAREVMMRAKAFGFCLATADPFISADKTREDGVLLLSFDDVLQQADIVSLHLPLNKNTHHIMNEGTLALMKPDAILINTSRGGLIDLKALVAALHNKSIAGAGIDVFEEEPIVQNHPIIDCGNVILTSHIAWYSESSIPILQQKATEEVIRGLCGQSLKNKVI